MTIVGEEVAAILHNGGVEVDGVTVDLHVFVLKDGGAFYLEEQEPVPADATGLIPDPMFSQYIGQRIVAVESADHWPTIGLRLDGGSVLVMGSPHPGYYGLQEATP